MIGELTRELTKIKLSSSKNKDAESRRAIFYALKKRGGVYIKCLQVLAVTQKFLDGWAGPAEMKVFDQVETEPVDLDRYIRRADFRFISKEPVACGSFAVVYRGGFWSGEDVAIKILRPSIKRTLKSDLKNLRLMTRLMAKFLPQSFMDYRTIIAEFSRTCLLETDYVREIENMEYFQKYYEGHPYVKIPKVFTEHSGEDVIVQEWIEGETFASALAGRSAARPATVIAKEASGSDLWTQMIVAGGEAVRMAMTADFVFGDPHPGNIKLLPDNRIAFIDFGIVARRPSSRMAFYRWVRTYRDVLTNKPGATSALIEASILCFCPDVALALKNCRLGDESAMDKIMGGLRDKMTSVVKTDSTAKDLFMNGHLFRLFTDVVDSNNMLGLRLDMANFQLLKAMQAYLGSMTVLDNSETRDRFAGAMLAAMEYALESVEKTGVDDDMPMGSRYSQAENLEILADTLSSLADGDEFLFNYLRGSI